MRTLGVGRQSEQGFSLLEILVVLMLLGMVYAAGSTMLVGGAERKAERQAMAAVEFLKEARRSAQLTGVSHRVNVLESELAVAGTNARFAKVGTIGFQLVGASHSGHIDNVIVFYPDGSSNGGVLQLRLKGETLQVEIDGLGRVYVGKGQG